MFGSKQRRIEDLTAENAALRDELEPHRPYFDVAERIRDEHLKLAADFGLGSVMIGGVVYGDPYDAAVEHARQIGENEVIEQAAASLVEHRKDLVVEHTTSELKLDPRVIAEADRQLSDPSTQASLAEEARMQAIDQLIEERKAVFVERFSELAAAHRSGEIDRAILIAELNFAFSATGTVDVSNDRLVDVLEHGDTAVIELNPLNDEKSLTVLELEWIEVDGMHGFRLKNHSIPRSRSLKGGTKGFTDRTSVVDLGSVISKDKERGSESVSRGLPFAIVEEKSKKSKTGGEVKPLHITHFDHYHSNGKPNISNRAIVRSIVFNQREAVDIS